MILSTQSPVSRAQVVPFPSPQPTPTRHILSVDFVSPDGSSWQAVGGGNTVAEAVAFARDSCPGDTAWQPAGWADLYGD